MSYYGTIEAAGAYHATTAGGAAWLAGTEPAREAALIRASRALDGMYGKRYPGTPTAGRAQPLGWPRIGAYDHCTQEELPSDEVPVEVEEAAYALALVELQNPGASTPTFAPGAVNKREKVDTIERERFGPADGVMLTLENQRAKLAEVEDLLRCILTDSGACQYILRV